MLDAGSPTSLRRTPELTHSPRRFAQLVSTAHPLELLLLMASLRMVNNSSPTAVSSRALTARLNKAATASPRKVSISNTASSLNRVSAIVQRDRWLICRFGAGYGAPPPQNAGPAPTGGPDAKQILQVLIQCVNDQGIAAFYPAGSLEPIAEAVARSGALPRIASEWKMPMEIAMDLCKLSLFDTILYCDDSGSMGELDQHRPRRALS